MTDTVIRGRMERQDISRFKSLIITPLTGAVTFPGNARVRLRSIAGCAAGTTAATITSRSTRTIKTPLLAAGGSLKIDWVERKSIITPVAGFEVYIDSNGFGKYRKIAVG
jgi:hypothetical protein